MGELRVEPLGAHCAMVTTTVAIDLLALQLVLDTLAVWSVADKRKNRTDSLD